MQGSRSVASGAPIRRASYIREPSLSGASQAPRWPCAQRRRRAARYCCKALRRSSGGTLSSASSFWCSRQALYLARRESGGGGRSGAGRGVDGGLERTRYGFGVAVVYCVLNKRQVWGWSASGGRGAVFSQSTHWHLVVQATRLRKHSQYFFWQRERLQTQPLMLTGRTRAGPAGMPANLGAKAAGLRRLATSMAWRRRSSWRPALAQSRQRQAGRQRWLCVWGDVR